MAAAPIRAQVGKRTVRMTNLDKVLYPGSGFTKAEVIDYYVRIAPVMLPHLKNRPVTRKRFPEGTGKDGFFEKQRPMGTPDWVRTVTISVSGSTMARDEIDFVLAEEDATLAWFGNLAALELHVPQWQVDENDQPQPPDLLVIDLDPGPPASVIQCAEVAFAARDLITEETGEEVLAKVSGSKGLQLYSPWPHSDISTHDYSRLLAERLAKKLPQLALATVSKNIRGGKVYVDFNQNLTARTTVAPYSLRSLTEETVSTPVTFEELAEAEHPADLVFAPTDVLSRVEEFGDLFAALLRDR